ncbi:unnamed protein product, partial [Ectocarpus fasciculatus]
GDLCSVTKAAPCNIDGNVVVDDLMCSAGVPGILVSDVCCPTSCGSCAGDGCTARDGGDTFTGGQACCGGGVRSLGRVCSAEVGAPCVVEEDPASAPLTWQFNGTELTLVETATWGSVISFEIPDSEGEVAELYYSRGVD